jgi:hypothetical protein
MFYPLFTNVVVAGAVSEDTTMVVPGWFGAEEIVVNGARLQPDVG